LVGLLGFAKLEISEEVATAEPPVIMKLLGGKALARSNLWIFAGTYRKLK